MKYIWIEEYRCGCSSSSDTKRELLGYCKIHGESRRKIYKVLSENKAHQEGVKV
jgi:hypothetical protein